MENFKLFFSNRSVDAEGIQNLIDNLHNILPNFPFEDISIQVPYTEDWKDKSSELIRNCDGFVCLISLDTDKSETIAWEIQEAYRNNKPIYIVTLSWNYPIPEICQTLNLQPKIWKPERTAVEIAEILLPKALFSQHDWSQGKPKSNDIIDLYKILVQSWEALIQRRQIINTIYLSASSAVLAGIGVLISSLEDIGNAWSLLSIIILAALGCFLSSNWHRTIKSYGTLSIAKSKVVLAFEEFLPAQIFNAEWWVLEVNHYRSTTHIDLRTARLFLGLFLIVIIISFVLLLFTIKNMSQP